MGEARRRYTRFVEEGLGEAHREEFHRGSGDPRVLGDDRFAQKVLPKADQRERKGISLGRVIGAVCREYGVSEAQLKTAVQQRIQSEARAVVGWLVLELGIGTLTEVGHRFNRDVGTMSSGARRVIDRSEGDPKLKKRLALLKSKLV